MTIDLTQQLLDFVVEIFDLLHEPCLFLAELLVFLLSLLLKLVEDFGMIGFLFSHFGLELFVHCFDLT
jgi:hypothetical protein